MTVAADRDDGSSRFGLMLCNELIGQTYDTKLISVELGAENLKP